MLIYEQFFLVQAFLEPSGILPSLNPDATTQLNPLDTPYKAYTTTADPNELTNH